MDTMKKLVLIIVGLVSIVGGYLIDVSNDYRVWLAVYPPPPRKIFLEGLPYLLWAVGVILIVVGVFGISKKK